MSEIDDLIPTHITAIARVAQLTERMRRITFANGLEHLDPQKPDAFVYVLLPPSGGTDLTVDTSFTWTKYKKMPEAERPLGAYYTIRSHWPDAGEIDVDFVL